MITVRATLVLPILAAFLAACGASESPQATYLKKLASGAPETAASMQIQRFAIAGQAGAPQMKFGVEELEIVTIAVMDTKRAGVETWLMNTGEAVAIQDGFLRNTRGFGDDLMSADISQTRAAVLNRRNGTVQRAMTFLGGEQQTVTQSYVCDIDVRGARELTVNTKAVPTTLVAETCRGNGQEFENLYWLRKSNGKMVQSRQWASNKTGPVVMRDGSN